MTKHTPEPWGVANAHNELRAIINETNRSGVVHLGMEKGLEDRANAARIVACVNACAGIPTEQLEAGSVAEAIQALRDVHMAKPPHKANGYNDYRRLMHFIRGRAWAALAPFQKD